MFSFSLNNNTSIDRDKVYLTLLVSDFTAGLTIHPLNVEPGQYRHSLNFTGCQIRPWNSSPSASAYSVNNTTFSFLTYAAEVLHNQTSAWVFINTSWCSMSCFLMCHTAVSCSWLHAIFMLHCPVGQPLPLCCFVNAFYRTTFFIVLLTGNAFPVTPLNHLQPKMLLYASQA